jgi:hypothetical protein
MELFDYRAINEEHKKAVQEVINLAKDAGNEDFAEYLKHKFEIIEPIKLEHTKTEFYRLCEKNDIKVWLMGWVQDGGGLDPSVPHYPVVSITEDIRKIEQLIAYIKNSK